MDEGTKRAGNKMLFRREYGMSPESENAVNDMQTRCGELAAHVQEKKE